MWREWRPRHEWPKSGVAGRGAAVGEFPAGGQEFRAVGTAVRAPGARRLRRPFTCDLSGQDFTKLIPTGWVPVGRGGAVCSYQSGCPPAFAVLGLHPS